MLQEIDTKFYMDQGKLAQRFEMGHPLEGRPLADGYRGVVAFRMNMALIVAEHLPTKTFNAWSAIIDDEALKNEVEKWVDGIKI